VTAGKHYEAKDRKTEKELDWHSKTRFKGNCHITGGSTRALSWQRVNVSLAWQELRTNDSKYNRKKCERYHFCVQFVPLSAKPSCRHTEW